MYFLESFNAAPVRTATPSLTGGVAVGQAAPAPVNTSLTVADTASGGSALSGVSDLFGGIGHMFNNLLHPGAPATTPTTPASTIPSMWVLLGGAVLAYLIFRR